MIAVEALHYPSRYKRCAVGAWEAQERTEQVFAAGWSYNDDCAAEDQVPEEVLLPAKFGVRGLQLARVLEDKICVHDDAQLRACEHEAGDEAPYLGRQAEELQVVEVDPGVGDDFHVAGNRGRQNASREGSARVYVNACPADRAAGVLGECLPRDGWRAPVGIHDVGHGCERGTDATREEAGRGVATEGEKAAKLFAWPQLPQLVSLVMQETI